MIKVIVFDLAGPITNNYDIPFLPWLKDLATENQDKLDELWEKHMYPAEEGECSEYYGLQNLCNELGIDVDPIVLQNKRFSCTIFNEDVAQFVNILRERGYHVVFATNNAAEEFARNYYTFKLGELFADGVASYQVGARKTKKIFFELLLKRLKVDANEVVFTDDGEKNLVAPAELGINTIHFTSLEALQDGLKKLGVTW